MGVALVLKRSGVFERRLRMNCQKMWADFAGGKLENDRGIGSELRIWVVAQPKAVCILWGIGSEFRIWVVAQPKAVCILWFSRR